MRRLVLLSVLALTVMAAVGYTQFRGKAESGRYYMTNNVVTTGDAAQVIKVHQFEAMDSFPYICSIYVATAITDSIVAWTAPVQKVRLTPEVTFVDTTITYMCSVVFAAQTLGFQYAVPEGATDTSVDTLINRLVDSFNNVAALKDTVLAQDSGTYILLRSRFGDQNVARWSMVIGDSLDTASINPTTIAMVVDSLVAAINGEDSIGAYVTAANSGDTVITITADDPGLAFSIGIGDTALDTSLATANGTSYSRSIDTTILSFNMCCPDVYNSLYGRIILEPSVTTTQGYGLADSARVRLWAWGINGFSQLATDSAAALPCTLQVNFPGAHAGVLSDTLYKEALYIITEVSDSASDSTFSPTHRVLWHLLRQQ